MDAGPAHAGRVMPAAPQITDGGFLFGADAPIPRRDTVVRRALALADVLGLLGAYGTVALVAAPVADIWPAAALLVFAPALVLLNKILRLYDRDGSLIHASTLNEFPAIFHSVSLGVALLFIAGPVIPGVEMQRTPLVVFWAASLVLTPLLRHAARSAVRRSSPPERTLMVGSGVVASLVARKVESHPEYGTAVVGYVDVAGDEAPGSADMLERLGDVHEFEHIVEAHEVERVVIAFSSLAHEDLLDVIRISKRRRLKISVVPRLFEVIGHNVELDQIEGMTLLGLRGISRSRSTLMLKRWMDVAGAIAGLLVLAPFFVLAALLIKLGSPGPVLFGQRRVGMCEREFTMWKFRTMVADAEAMKAQLAHLNEMEGGEMFKIAEDPRVTRAGRLLRRLSLDELPQLFNVLRGDMSLVGPRPLVPEESDQVIGWHRARLDLMPGLTGPWQVLGRNQIPFSEMVKLDYLYVADWSLWNDVKLILRTLPVVLSRRGS